MATLRLDHQVRALLARLTASDGPAFAVLDRGGDAVDVLVGSAVTVTSTADIPVGTRGSVALLPFRQLAERGLPCRDDGTPLRVLIARERHEVPRDVLVRTLPAGPAVTRARFDEDDDAYADLMRRVAADDLSSGGVTHCSLRRGFTARLVDPGPAAALGLLGGLLRGERGSHWTFAVHDGGAAGRALVGAPPLGQVQLDGDAEAHPTCGTYRYPAAGPEVDGVVEFLHDHKESDELAATVDAELAALCALAPDDVRMEGPHLLPMSRLAHTGCTLRATGPSDARQVLAGTMFAPTAIGAPVAGALRVISAREPEGRGYYGGAAALFEPDGTLDATTLIRTADIDGSGLLRVSVSATVGADSSPTAETAETRTKVEALLGTLGGGNAAARPAPTSAPPFEAERVVEALDWRRRQFGAHWTSAGRPVGHHRGRLLVVDLGDPAAATLAHLARRCGWRPVLRKVEDLTGADLTGTILFGPGPGHPDDPGLARAHAVVRAALRGGEVRGVGLGFQLLACELGLRMGGPRRAPGSVREVDVFGIPNTVVPRNAFAVTGRAPSGVEVCRDEPTGEVLALRTGRARGVQFRPESVLALDGLRVLDDLLRPIDH